MRKTLLAFLLAVPGQAAPPALPNDYPLHALVGATIYVTPERVLHNATLVISQGKVAAVGENLQPPAGARRWDCQGKTIHAGFIDLYLGEEVRESEPASASGRGDRVDDEFTAAGGAQGEPASVAAAVRSERRVQDSFELEEERKEALHRAGLLTFQVVPQEGVLRGHAAIYTLAEKEPWLREQSAFVVGCRDVDEGAQEQDFPASLMGNLALLKEQFRLASWKAKPLTQSPYLFYESRTLQEGLSLQRVLESLPNLPKLVWVTSPDCALRPQWIRGKCLVGLELPDFPKWKGRTDKVSYREGTIWRQAPQLASQLGDYCLTSHGLKELDKLPGQLSRLQSAGASPAQLLAAFTTRPAEWMQLSDLGSLEVGKKATLVVRQGDFFKPNSRVTQTWVEGKPYRWAAETASEEEEAKSTRGPAPQSPPQWRGAGDVWVRGATLWTQLGKPFQGDLLVRQGKIVGVGQVPGGSTQVVEGQGLHLLPGLIDAHSHSALVGDVNEGTRTVTAAVDTADIIDPLDENIYRQLAGGVTCANLLHGSANAIGGRSVTVKWRWGARPEQMILEGAPRGIKFALGENPKQSNWGDRYTKRYPQSRQGVAALIRQRFLEARAYQKQSSPRPDLDLEALVEVLEGKRLVHCHSYRQDEILMLLQVADEFGFRVATLQHGLEAYKVADEVARRGTGVSTFTDWWAYKLEVQDAIPYNGALLHQRGVLTSFNSDSDELARRLLGEARKAVRYGGVPEVEALRFVTLHPARQLGIDSRLGSLEVGKDGDFSLWSGSPFESDSYCLSTWVDGCQVYDFQQARQLYQQRSEHIQQWLEGQK